MKDLFQLIRLQQWIKNSFIFFPAFFAGLTFEANLIVQLLIGFLSFSFMASAVYVLNDYFDREFDKKHPKKRNRPLASGRVSVVQAFGLCLILLALSQGLSFYLNSALAAIVTFYFLLNVAYSVGLKHIAVLDVIIISVGFVLRLIYGGYLVNVPLSNWILLVGFSLSLFLAFAKRRADFILFQEEGKKARKVISSYSSGIINLGIYLSACITFVSYAAYCLSPWATRRFGWELIFSAIFVLLGLIRYFILIFKKNKAANPTQVLYSDRIIQLCVVAWVTLLLIIIFR